MSELRHVELDSAQLRCLAHPLRSRLLAALRLDGPATSARLAHRLTTNTGATSYHLRQLAAVGLIEEDPDRGRGRERYWRSVHDVTNWTETRFDDDPEDRAAAEWLTGHHLRLKNRWREDWLESRMEWSTAWREAASLGDMRVRLTPAQTTAMVNELEAVVERHLTAGPVASEDHASAEGTADVFVLLDVFPTRQALL
ncbi:MAG: ArsR/SmtB family transcription factor [Aeromicrobium sp.]